MSQPVILVHSSIAPDDAAIAELIGSRHPDVTVLTASTEDEVREHLPSAEILFAWDFPLHLIDCATSLRWFQVMGAGIEKLAGAPIPDGVTVTNVRGVFGGAMSEYVLAWTLAHLWSARRIFEQQARHEWEPFRPGRLAGLTLGVIGLGSIGQEIARACAGLGMRVVGLKRDAAPVPHVERVYGVAEIESFLPECDVLVSVVPHTAETTGLLSRERLQLLKPTALYINIGRGNIVAPVDIIHALREGWLAAATLDVFPEEPLPANHPLWDAPNLTITPHISGVNRPDDVTDIFLTNLAHYLAGEELVNVVDVRRGY